jgi:sugar lactone lactonase YvrE
MEGEMTMVSCTRNLPLRQDRGGSPWCWIAVCLIVSSCDASDTDPPRERSRDAQTEHESEDSSVSTTDARAPTRAKPVDAATTTQTPIDAADAAAGSSITTSNPSEHDTGVSTPSTQSDAGASEGIPTLFYLDAVGGRVMTVRPDEKKPRALVSNQRSTPDGIAADVHGGRLYWTNMGVPTGDDGTLLSSKLDGSDVKTIVPSGGTFTPKQLTLDAMGAELYWSDREGMRVMRSKLDGTSVEALVTIAEGDSARAVASNWAVGIGVDLETGFVYWTQKGSDNGGQGSIRRAPIKLASGESSSQRSDVEVLFQDLPEPIDLALDLSERKIYWTDRGDNTVSRAPMDPPAGTTPAARTDRQILVKGLGEAIGIALDLRRGNVYYTDLGGRVGTCKLDGSGAQTVVSGQGSLTGITFVELPK